jgi:Concanavalin A-like lectin/glucanases superfamily
VSQELLGLQAHGVALRLVQSVTQLRLAGMPIPSGPQVGSQVTVLGQPFIPSWAGINGQRGFSQGQIELRLYEEGIGSITLPNAGGEDGVLHRRRLLITQTGRVTPKGGNVTMYSGGAFRPGDEYIEVYRTSASGAPGKLIFVCAVTKATIDSGSIVIDGNDALWLLKKTRESSAGVFFNAPRDVIEHYTKVKQIILADDFPQDGRFNTSATQTADGMWAFQQAFNVPGSNANGGASTWSSSLGTVVRLQTYGSNQNAYLSTIGGAPLSTFIQGRADPWVRWEARFRFAPGFSPSSYVWFQLSGLASGVSMLGTAGPGIQLNAGPSGTGNVNPPGYVMMFNSVGTQAAYSQIPNFNPLAWHTATVEMRDRYIFFYVDGRLLGLTPQQGAVDNGWYGKTNLGTWYSFNQVGGQIQLQGNAGTSAGLDVDYAVLRSKQPGMLRPASAANLGDYSIGGTPAPGSALLEVWHFDDQPFYGLEFSPGRLSQFAGKFPASSGSFGGTIAANVPDWWPSQTGVGAWYNSAWACRCSGSMYLTLGSYDYRFRFNADDGARLWVGKTRFGEQLADNWRTATQTGHVSQIFVTPYLKASSIASTTLGANANAGATQITLSAQPANSGSGMLVRIGSAPPYEWAYLTNSPSGGVFNLRDALVRAHSSGDPVIILNQGSLAGMPSGWYPFIFEFYNNPQGASGGATLQYERSDQVGYWNGIGAGAYIHTVASMIAAYGGGTVPNHYWPLSDGYWNSQGPGYYDPAGGTVASISTADANSLIGTTRSTLVPSDQAPVFNGGVASGRTGDYLNAGAVPISTSQWTIGALFRADVLPGTQMDIIRKDLAIFLGINSSSQVQVQAYNGSSWVSATGPTVVAGQWYHVVATWDGSTIRLYVSGQLSSSTAFTGQANNSNVLAIGTFWNGTSGSEWFGGAVGHALALSKAMSAADVATLYGAVSSAPYVPVSQSGIVDTTNQPLRYVSHYDQLIQFVKDWGYQITTESMQLESGEFPGRLRPLLRVGRDTEYVVGSPQVRRSTSSDIQDAITAEDVCDALVADAQGLADPTGATQVSAEVFNFAAMFGTTPSGGPTAGALHPWVSEEYDQSNDVSFPDLLVQRLYSRLALRGAPWEQVSMSHRPERQIVDTFPLTGSVAEFNWSPGDGIRLDMPEYGIKDLSARQILGVQWPITPAGLGAPAISLRQRPRNFQQVLRDMFRSHLAAQRSYQGQTGPINSSLGGYSAGTVDAYARAALPQNLATVVTASFVVLSKNDAVAYPLEINGNATGITVATTGYYDITPWLARLTGVSGGPYFYARLTGVTTASIAYFVQLNQKV